MIKGTTQLLGVIGYPVEHSFSPLMHNAAIAHLNAQASNEPSKEADFVYLPFPIHPDLLAMAIAGFTAIGLRGFNITIPHKQAIIPLLDEVSDVACAIGAVNTVWRDEDAQGMYKWCGTNTDAVGFLAPLQTLGRDWSNTPAMVLGNGGAARAVVAACVQLGCPEVWVVGRSLDKLEAFAQSWSAAPEIAEKLAVVPWEQLGEHLPKAGLVVNATPLGMHPEVNASPLSEAEIGRMGSGAIAYDLIYTPRPTRFLQKAHDAGLTAIDGLEMLVQQGAAALEIWLEQPAPVDVMRQTLLDYLANRGSLNEGES
ncbi:MAG: shikimate dehydrogenase [Cyanobacteria bacterium P01_F01_bin.53]